jgi:hypothetical protein
MRRGIGFPRADQGGLTINPEGPIPLATEIAANRGVAWMVAMPNSSVDKLSPTDGVDGPNGISVPQYGS